MASSSLNAGIIGTGGFAETHAEAIAKTESVTLSAVHDIDQGKAEAFVKKFGGEVTGSIDALLSKGMDIVTITTPNATHTPMAIDILGHADAPKLLILEKPMSLSEKELNQLGAAAKASKTKLVVDHSRRFNAGFMKLKAAIDAGEFGSPLLSATWKYYAGFMHIAPHVIDTLRMLLGDLQCIEAKKGPVDRIPDDPLLDLVLKAKSAPDAEIKVIGIPEQPYKVFEAELWFPKGRVRIQWNDIFVDKARDDSYSPLLDFNEHFAAEGIVDAISRLYDLSAKQLNEGDDTVLQISGYDVARGTMDVLFDAQSKAK